MTPVAIAGVKQTRRDLRTTVGARLAMLIVFAFMPVLLMSAAIAWQSYRAAGESASRTAIMARGAAAARVDAVMDELRHLIAASAKLKDIGSDRVACGVLLADLLSVDDERIADLAVVDAYGRIQCSAGSGIPGLSADLPALIASLPAGGFVMGQAHANTPDMLFGIAPIPSDHGDDLAVIGGLRVDRILRTPDHDQNAGGSAQLATWFTTRNGRTVALANATPGMLPTDRQLRPLIAAGGTTGMQYSADGHLFTYASMPLSKDFGVLVGYPARHDQRHALLLLLRRTLLIAVLVALGLIASLYGARLAIVRPIMRLSSAVREWRQAGMFRMDLRHAPVEIEELSHSFEAATSSLADREMQLRGATAQQELLMQEIHHRVKNNLQIVASLLNLQASRIRQPEAKAEFQSARDRVRALATLHRHLYSHGEVHTINMRSFLVELCGQLFQAMGENPGERIHLAIDATELQMSSDQAVPLALIVTEAVSNAVKYAFPGGRGGHVSVALNATETEAHLVIRDDGVGIPAGRAETETGTRDGLGLQLIRGFARQLGATLSVQEGEGTRYEVVMPLQRERDLAQQAAEIG